MHKVILNNLLTILQQTWYIKILMPLVQFWWKWPFIVLTKCIGSYLERSWWQFIIPSRFNWPFDEILTLTQIKTFLANLDVLWKISIRASSWIMNTITRSFIVKGQIAKILPNFLKNYIFNCMNKQSFSE